MNRSVGRRCRHFGRRLVARTTRRRGQRRRETVVVGGGSGRSGRRRQRRRRHGARRFVVRVDAPRTQAGATDAVAAVAAVADFAFLLFFELHAPVLEPNFDLALRQVEQRCHFDASRAAEVAVEVELFLQFNQLRRSVRRTGSFGWLFCSPIKKIKQISSKLIITIMNVTDNNEKNCNEFKLYLNNDNNMI